MKNTETMGLNGASKKTYNYHGLTSGHKGRFYLAVWLAILMYRFADYIDRFIDIFIFIVIRIIAEIITL